MAIIPKFPYLFHGGDYSPDQWPDATQLDDVRLMKLARVNMVSVAIFSWATLEVRENEFRWDWLDRTFDRLHKAGVGVALATPSAAPPRWLSAKYPETVKAGDTGRTEHPGTRQRYCPSSPRYREEVRRINAELAKRYGKHPALAMWHISNEYHNTCHCDLCAAAFRDWLKARYGDLDTLNHQYWANFWSQRFADWSEVIPPYADTGWDRSITAHALDWKRFRTHAAVEFMKHEIAAVRPHSPGVPVTTNLMGLFPDHDYAKFADAIDFVSWDSYPTVGDPRTPFSAAFSHALMRGVKQQKPWVLLEQSPSNTNWQEYGTLKPPGLLALWTWQAVAHGSDACMYFQWRRGRGGAEKFHGAIVEHEGSEKPRVFQECAALGRALEKISPHVVGTTVGKAKVGILWNHETRWAYELSAGFSKHKSYGEALIKHFHAVWKQNIPIDVVRVEDDFSQYAMILAPVLYTVPTGEFPKAGSPEQLRTKFDLAKKLELFVEGGGTFVATYHSGIANENDLVFEGGYPGPLRKLLGVWVEEQDANAPGKTPNRIMLRDGVIAGHQSAYACDKFFDLLHAETATVLGTYGDNWYKGRPALTENTFGNGKAYYLATDADDAFLADFYRTLAANKGITPLAEPTEGVEVLERVAEGRRLLFVLNHADACHTVKLPSRGLDLLTDQPVSAGALTVPPYGAFVIACE